MTILSEPIVFDGTLNRLETARLREAPLAEAVGGDHRVRVAPVGWGAGGRTADLTDH